MTLFLTAWVAGDTTVNDDGSKQRSGGVGGARQRPEGTKCEVGQRQGNPAKALRHFRSRDLHGGVVCSGGVGPAPGAKWKFQIKRKHSFWASAGSTLNERHGFFRVGYNKGMPRRTVSWQGCTCLPSSGHPTRSSGLGAQGLQVQG